MKAVLAISLACSIALALLAFDLHYRNTLLKEEVESYRDDRANFLQRISESASDQVENEGEVERLRNDLASSDRQIAELTERLQEARSMVDPDVAQLQSSNRAEVEEAFMQEQSQMDDRRMQLSVVSELSTMPPDRLNTLLRVNALYGEFFSSLNVSDERMEVLVNAFVEMTEMQNDALEEVRSYNPRNKEEAEALMLPILDSDLVNEVISVELTDEELALFTEYQENHFVEGLPVRPEF